MSISTMESVWWSSVRLMAERRYCDEGKDTGVLVMGERAFDALCDLFPEWNLDAPVNLGRCRFTEVLLSYQFLPWQVIIMDSCDLVPDIWFEEREASCPR